jgi:predicted HTH domain antitoxin
MTTMTITLPDTVFSAVRRAPAEFIQEMRIEAATQWYAQQRISQEKAAEIAGLGRADFIDALALRHIPLVQVDFNELMDEVRRA